MQQPDFIVPSFNPGPFDSCFCNSGSEFKDCCGSMAPGRSPPHGVHAVRGFLDQQTCAKWIAALDQQPGQPTSINAGDGHQVKKSRVTEWVFFEPVEQAVTDLVRKIYTTTVAEATGRTFAWFERPQILRYTTGGHYGIHADSERLLLEQRSWQKTVDRDMSLLLYLNDDFSGGELSFIFFNYVFKPKAGDLLFFPSDHRYAHQAHTVRGGRRYAVVSWAAFADEPRVHDQPTESSIAL